MADEPENQPVIDEEVAWLEQRLAQQDEKLSSMTVLLSKLVEKSERTEQPIHLTAEQMETLKALLESSTGKTAEKLEAILLKLEKPSDLPDTSNREPSPNPNGPDSTRTAHPENRVDTTNHQSNQAPRKRVPTSYRPI